MSKLEQRIIDRHVHLDHIHKENPERIRWLSERMVEDTINPTPSSYRKCSDTMLKCHGCP